MIQDQQFTLEENFEAYKMSAKAEAADFLGRFREIVSDPLNLLIERHPLAGYIEDDLVYLHNGHRVPYAGPYSYYEGFSNILVINRGVHEPVEEYVFQELLKVIPHSPNMLELGAYWGHYSMWLKQSRPQANVCLVEPELHNLEVGCLNFDRHGYDGNFIHAFVGQGNFEVDEYFSSNNLEYLDILHSDIQGYELEMLQGGFNTLKAQKIGYVLISTHSQQLHIEVVGQLENFGYRIEVSSDFAYQTTSFDGFVLASSPQQKSVFKEVLKPLGRVDIAKSQPIDLVNLLAKMPK